MNNKNNPSRMCDANNNFARCNVHVCHESGFIACCLASNSQLTMSSPGRGQTPHST